MIEIESLWAIRKSQGLNAPSIGRDRSEERAASIELCSASRASASWRRSERQ